jgi:ABC-type transport system substrate-binding protein
MLRLSFHLINSAIGAYVRWERWILAGLAVLFLGSLGILLTRFYWSNTHLVPRSGGTYIEGSVGELLPLNPWFTVTNDVNRDIVSLVFSGLLKYNPATQKIEEDLATMTKSKDGLTYTLKLKKDLFWHDSNEEKPHPVTANDVVFTYQTIQDPRFPNTLLRQNFQGVEIEKVDDRTVQFTLDDPYSFFPSNLTLGLLPKSSFEGVPPDRLDQALDFAFHPIGAGPYQMHAIAQTELSTEVTLERFDRSVPPEYLLDRIVFRIFPDYQSLLSDTRNLDGIRLVPYTDRGEPASPGRFTPRSYTLPQYVALFFNLDRKIVQDKQLRLGLQLGTNKQEMVDAIGQAEIMDTPLLEIDTSDWRYSFDAAAAQGALFESAWYFPEKVRLQRLLEQREANNVGFLRVTPIAFLETGALLTVTGSIKDLKDATGVKLNNVPVQPHPTQSGAWIARLPTAGTGALKQGDNLVKLVDGKGKILDSFYLWRTGSALQFQRANQEQRLLDLFLRSKTAAVPIADKIGAQDLFQDKGFLRRRTPQDPVGTRVNDANQKLALTLVTSDTPPTYQEVAKTIQKQWAALGVQVNIVVPKTRQEFEDRLLKRDYDLLLFGQSLLDNLDSYPYWHSSGEQNLSGKRSDLKIDAYNLSQYSSFEADSLLETIRRTSDESERADSLKKLRAVLAKDVPAIVLYTPVYTFAHRQDILGLELGDLSLHSDRFLTLDRWYVKQQRVFLPGKGWTSFFGWLSSLFSQETGLKLV